MTNTTPEAQAAVATRDANRKWQKCPECRLSIKSDNHADGYHHNMRKARLAKEEA